jgi:hypothetical protein
MGSVLACRTTKASIFKTSLKSNKWILVGMIAQISIISVLIYVPLMQTVFGTTAIGPADWGFLLILPITVIVAEEIRKWFSRRLSK